MPKNKTKIIEIACPHQRRVIKGFYPCGPDGRYLLTAGGVFNLDLVECSQDEGRCAETLCALHRFNRRGPGTWYPDEVRAMRESKELRKDRCPPVGGNSENGKKDNTSFDQLC